MKILEVKRTANIERKLMDIWTDILEHMTGKLMSSKSQLGLFG